MSELGYHAQIEGGVHGVPDPGDPIVRAALQERYARMAIDRAGEPGSVPQSYEHVGTGVLPTPGWTAQADEGTDAFPDYTFVGHTPDWTGDSNPIGAGAYDQTQLVAYGDYNPLNVAPLGDGVLQFDDTPVDPNALPMDVGGTVGDLEY